VQSPLPLSNKEKAILAVGLSWGAGLIDVIGYLTLYHAFVAHMTGNTVSSVMHGMGHNWREMLHRGAPIPAFFAGLLAGEVALEAAKRRRRRHVASRALAIEAICLAAFLGFGTWILGAGPKAAAEPTTPQFVFLVALIAVAMGVQSAALRKVGALTVFTTFITGTLTKLAQDLSEYLFWLRDRTRGRFRNRLGKALRLSPRQESFQSVVLLALLYLAYGGGAVFGVFGFHRWGVTIAAAPLALVLVAIGADLARPISPVP
jgi:uncharacterized membrane protein YoaK (UPF0700 family)